MSTRGIQNVEDMKPPAQSPQSHPLGRLGSGFRVRIRIRVHYQRCLVVHHGFQYLRFMVYGLGLGLELQDSGL